MTTDHNQEVEEDKELNQDVEDEGEDSLSAALAAEWGAAPWYVSSVGVHLVLFLILFLIPVTPPLKQPTTLDLTTQIVEEEEEEEEEEKPEVEVVEKEKIDQEITETPVEVPEITEVNIEITDHVETEDNVDDATAAGDPDNMATFDSEFTGTPALMGVGASGGGGGGGRFGNRGRGGRKKALMKGGGSKKTESAVNLALAWLAAHQESDGRWDCNKYGGTGSYAEIPMGRSANNGGDAAVTSWALLAFLGAGNSVGFGKYKSNVKRGVEWLMTQQKPTGEIGVYRYVGGITLMAIAEAYGMSEGHPLAKKIGVVAQKAVDNAVKTQGVRGSWAYYPNSAESDHSVTGWWVMGLKSAYVAGLHVPDKTFKKALSFLRSWTNDEGRSGYKAPFTGDYRPRRMVAVANTCLQFMGDGRNNKRVIATAENLIAAHVLPKESDEKKDFYRMYYQALGLFQMGVKSKYWKAFNEPMKKHLLGTQVLRGSVKDKRGSWNYAGDHFGKCWGRVGQTALGALMLEVYYRYKQGAKVGARH